MKNITIEKTSDLINKPIKELLSEANSLRKKFIGERLDVCSIMNAKSGLCSEDCKFCAQSCRHNTNISTYPLKDADKIVKEALKAEAIGAKRFGIVTSGNKLTVKELETIGTAISEIKKVSNIDVCGSLGALSQEQLTILKNAGLSRYHHNIETSKNFYSQVVSTHNFKDRLKTIESAQQVGLEVCSGGIIGMGESWEDRIDMAYTLRDLNVCSVPINFLIPIKGTIFEQKKTILAEEALRTLSIFRIILKDKTIKIAAGREAILKEFQIDGFMAGANGMLIGGYLTTTGQSVEKDTLLIQEISKLWKE